MKIGDKIKIKEEYSNEFWYHNKTMIIKDIFEFSFNDGFLCETDMFNLNHGGYLSEKYIYKIEEQRQKKLDSL